MVRPNRTKAKLKNGDVVFGATVNPVDATLVEMFGYLGFDFVIVDCEHELFNGSDLENLIRAGDIYNVTTIVRMQNNPEFILHALDSGAQGVLVARVNNKPTVTSIVDSAKFFPVGKRTLFYRGRGGSFGEDMESPKEWTRQINEETLIGCIIEEEEAFNNLQDIINVDAVDFIDIGPLDLAQSMGWPSPDKANRMVDEIIDSSLAAGKTVVSAGSMENIESQFNRGIRAFTVSPRTMVQSGAKNFLREAKQIVSHNTL
ncbi:hypothetical protein FIM04_04930 [SAR202 cluster bacterium AC-409-J13_OGT_754m]|nr:hypothetical protein [SAR202 cluster bacterium AC-409-J13_OGT_754m]